MKLIHLQDSNKVNTFVSQQELAQFLQSFYWQKILQSQNKETVIVGVVDDEQNILLTSLLVKNKFKFFSYYYSPRGPIVVDKVRNNKVQLAEVLNFWLSEIKKITREEHVGFLRLEPNFDWPNNLNVLKSTFPIQPQKTLLLDLTLSEEELLKKLHQKTRYNLRLAGKKGVTVREGSIDDVDSFFDLLEETKDRNHFGIHSKMHYYNLLVHSKDKVKLILAEHEGVVIAGGLFSYFGNQAIYLHGASHSSTRHLMAPYLVQWEAIKIAKYKKCRWYDFGGIDESKWPGVTRFKMGFSGVVYDYPGTFDLVFNPFIYGVYKVLRNLRRKLS